ncbi:GNAT family N-acetyltransferase [Streptomyces sp. NPDC056656]|uniref:GNAT family N-acetyltransferase n=1 Tax=Streptomyces sp. NPDC056656 TaxID=3345895 RepID=UPI0036BC7BA0
MVSMEHLAVDPGRARSGVGAALVDAVRDVGRRAGCRRPVASVWEFDDAARPFYQAIGLRPMQVRMDQPLQGAAAGRGPVPHITPAARRGGR